MNALVALMMGRPLREEEAAPLPAAARQSSSGRSRLNRHRRVSAAMLGLGEADGDDSESIIPDDAEPIDGVAGPSGIKMDQAKSDQDQEADEPNHPITPDEDAEQLMTPKDALVAPDITPEIFEPIDPSDVPAPAAQARPRPPAAPSNQAGAMDTLLRAGQGQSSVNPMDVLLGRASPGGQSQHLPEEPVVTAEAAQATVNGVLGIGGSGDGLLRQGQAMPDPVPSQPGKIMETFFKYGPKPTLRF